MNTTLKGLTLALTTALLWGSLPIALKQVLPVLDAMTIVWLRFLVAALWMWIMGGRAASVHGTTRCSRHVLFLFACAVLGLGGNFYFFNASLAYMGPAASQILFQAGPILLLAGSIAILREPFIKIQGAGVIILLCGLGLFFNTRLLAMFRPGDMFAIGLVFGMISAAAWAMFGLAQKVLLRELSPAGIMKVIYTSCAIMFLPLASPAGMLEADFVQWLCLVFCCANTILAYGAFNRAMECWHAAKVGAIITTAPLFTLLVESLLGIFLPGFVAGEQITLASGIGAIVVVLGALGISIGPALHLSCFRRKDD